MLRGMTKNLKQHVTRTSVVYRKSMQAKKITPSN